MLKLSLLQLKKAAKRIKKNKQYYKDYKTRGKMPKKSRSHYEPFDNLRPEEIIKERKHLKNTLANLKKFGYPKTKSGRAQAKHDSMVYAFNKGYEREKDYSPYY